MQQQKKQRKLTISNFINAELNREIKVLIKLNNKVHETIDVEEVKRVIL